MYDRFTDRARKVFQLATQEAQRLNHDMIDTHHVLLGLLKEGAGVAATVLKNLDVDLRKIRHEVEKLVKEGPDMVAMGRLRQTPETKKVIEYAIEEARNLNHNYVGTEHILLGLLREGEGLAFRVLNNHLGLTVDFVRKSIVGLLAAYANTPVNIVFHDATKKKIMEAAENSRKAITIPMPHGSLTFDATSATISLSSLDVSNLAEEKRKVLEDNAYLMGALRDARDQLTKKEKSFRRRLKASRSLYDMADKECKTLRAAIKRGATIHVAAIGQTFNFKVDHVDFIWCDGGTVNLECPSVGTMSITGGTVGQASNEAKCFECGEVTGHKDGCRAAPLNYPRIKREAELVNANVGDKFLSDEGLFVFDGKEWNPASIEKMMGIPPDIVDQESVYGQSKLREVGLSMLNQAKASGYENPVSCPIHGVSRGVKIHEVFVCGFCKEQSERDVDVSPVTTRSMTTNGPPKATTERLSAEKCGKILAKECITGKRWTGAAGNNDVNDPGNWEGGTLPRPGDTYEMGAMHPDVVVQAVIRNQDGTYRPSKEGEKADAVAKIPAALLRDRTGQQAGDTVAASLTYRGVEVTSQKMICDEHGNWAPVEANPTCEIHATRKILSGLPSEIGTRWICPQCAAGPISDWSGKDAPSPLAALRESVAKAQAEVCPRHYSGLNGMCEECGKP